MTTRHMFQGVTNAQKSIVEYWKENKAADGRMRRSAVNAGLLRSQLANISIVEIKDSGECRFRLAGSQLRNALGVDARGRRVNDVMNDFSDVYALSIVTALEAGRPVGGVIEHEGELISWLRIPMVGKSGTFSQVLCHDVVLPHESYILDDAPIATNVVRLSAAA